MAKSSKESFYPNRQVRRFGWLSVILAVAANVLIFFSISWVNHEPARHQPRDYTAIEVFRPEFIPENILPVIDSVPVLAETHFQPKPEPMTLTQMKESLLRPRLIEWMPDALLKQPGVPIDISLTESELTDIGDISDALALNQVDRPPQKISGASPVYPLWAKAGKAEGSVTLRFIVDVDGKVHNIEVHSIRGDERFATAAKKAVEKWRFKPAVNRARPVAVWCFQKIHFKLED